MAAILAANNRENAMKTAIDNYRSTIGAMIRNDAVPLAGEAAFQKMRYTEATQHLPPSLYTPPPVSGKLDLKVSARYRKDAIAHFKAIHSGLYTKQFSTNARVLMSAFPTSTQDAILDHFKGQFGPKMKELTEQDVYDYLVRESRTPEKQLTLQKLLQEVKQTGSTSLISGTPGNPKAIYSPLTDAQSTDDEGGDDP